MSINQNKLEMLIRAHGRGEVVDLESVPMLLDISTPAIIKKYFKAFNEWKEDYEQTEDESTADETEESTQTVETTPEEPKVSFDPNNNAKKKAKKKQAKVKDPKDFVYILEGDDGRETVLEAVTVSTTSVLLKEVKPIMKKVMIDGVSIEVDLRKLRKMSPDQKIQGVSLSSLIIAAEIA